MNEENKNLIKYIPMTRRSSKTSNVAFQPALNKVL